MGAGLRLFDEEILIDAPHDTRIRIEWNKKKKKEKKSEIICRVLKITKNKKKSGRIKSGGGETKLVFRAAFNLENYEQP